MAHIRKEAGFPAVGLVGFVRARVGGTAAADLGAASGELVAVEGEVGPRRGPASLTPDEVLHPGPWGAGRQRPDQRQDGSISGQPGK